MGIEDVSQHDNDVMQLQLRETQRALSDLRENNEMLRDYVKSLKK